MSKRWLAEHRSDTYHKKSKQDGYYARSAYKLLNINEKFNIFKNVRFVLDLGASPGSWLQVTVSKLEKIINQIWFSQSPDILNGVQRFIQRHIFQICIC